MGEEICEIYRDTPSQGRRKRTHSPGALTNFGTSIISRLS